MIIKFFLDSKKLGGVDARVITLEKEVILNEKVQIAQLPNENEKCAEYGKNMVISGWGLTWAKRINETNSRLPTVPMYLKQQCLNISFCPLLIESFNEICVGDLVDPRNSACQGDSGGKIRF